MDRFDACLAFTLKEEGGFVDNPEDPGGATNAGITLAVLREYLRWDCPVDTLKYIDSVLVRSVYQNLFWGRMDCGSYPPGVDLMVWDFGVTAGQGRSIRVLQTVVGADVDGKPGLHTVAAVKGSPVSGTIYRLADDQRAWYRSLPKFNVFGKGWLARTQRRMETALATI